MFAVGAGPQRALVALLLGRITASHDIAVLDVALAADALAAFAAVEVTWVCVW
jgi:hypothetical protein